MKDTEIIKSIKASLEKNLHIDLVSHPIHVRVENDAVIMEGMVERIAHKKKALLAAMGLPGIAGVVDRLRVRPSAAMDDRVIRKHIQDAFEEEAVLKGLSLEIDAAGGIVDIEGTAPSLSHKRLAGLLAWWVPGVMDVINSLEVTPPEEDTDDEITDAVMLAMEKDSLVTHGNISAKTKNYVVTLSGAVRSEVEKEAAEDNAWYIWGVNDVKNELKLVRG